MVSQVDDAAVRIIDEQIGFVNREVFASSTHVPTGVTVKAQTSPAPSKPQAESDVADTVLGDLATSGERLLLGGRLLVERGVRRQPIEALVLAGAIGYLVGWAMIHIWPRSIRAAHLRRKRRWLERSATAFSSKAFASTS